MEDISPKLLEQLRAHFLETLEKNARAAGLLQQIKAGAAGYAEAGEYAYEVGTALSETFRVRLSSDILPDGRMYQNIAEKVVAPLLGDDYALVSKAAAQVQQTLNQAAGLGLKAQAAALDTERVQGIIHKVATSLSYDDVAWVLDEPVKTFSQSVVDATLQKNAEFQSKSGLRPRIIRKAETKCCEWCSRMEGVYDYPDVPDDVYRRHERCRCVVEYDPGDGKRKTIHAAGDDAQKRALEKSQKERIERYNAMTEDEQRKYDAAAKARAKFAAKKEPENVLPEYLRSATPGKGSITYDTGYDVRRHAEEIKTAQWLHDNLGGDIVLLNEINETLQKTPDYIWRERLWDLKTISSEKAANSAVRHGIKQIEKNPGGIILDFGEQGFSQEKLWEIVSKRMGWYNPQGEYDILVIAKNILVAAKRY